MVRGVRDDGGISGGLRRTRMQDADPAHRQPREVGHGHALVQGYGDRQGTDGGRLVDDQQHGSVGLHSAVELAEFGLVVGERPIQQFLPRSILRDRVVSFLADVQTEEHGDLVIPPEHEYLPGRFRPSRPADLPDQRAASLGIHVTVGLADEFGRSSPYERSPATHRDQRQHPPDHGDRGRESYRSR
jgi:hypothetical protein